MDEKQEMINRMKALELAIETARLCNIEELRILITKGSEFDIKLMADQYLKYIKTGE